jgi:hypothetical protein
MAILATGGSDGPIAPSGWLRACRTSTSFRKALSSAKAAVARSPPRGALSWNL